MSVIAPTRRAHEAPRTLVTGAGARVGRATAIELARAERLAASRARTACAHAAATIMPVHTVAQKSPVAYTPAADEPAAS